ncbi:MAG: hypothetical protein M1829_001606 [Trizodia sp. TS-e1964]|nr:MAG: hypothetical protein M1829_001606 [Trizodia sp. TS-e1964]
MKSAASSSSLLFSSSLFLLLLLRGNHAQQTAPRYCFWPDGTIDQLSVPCRAAGGANGPHSMCCTGNNQSACLSNGLCLWLGDFTVDRNSCTDRSWQDPMCTRICSNVTLNAHSDTQPCPLDQMYICCGQTTNCCASRTEGWDLTVQGGRYGSVFAPEGDVVSSSSSSSSSSSTSSSSSSAATVTVTASSTASAAPSTSSSPSKQTLIAIGAGIGVPLGLLLLLTLALLFNQNRRSRNRKYASGPSDAQAPVEAPGGRDSDGYRRTLLSTSELGSTRVDSPSASPALGAGRGQGQAGEGAGYHHVPSRDVVAISELPTSHTKLDTPMAKLGRKVVRKSTNGGVQTIGGVPAVTAVADDQR